MEDIFSKLRKLLRRLFHIFGFFSSEQSEEHTEQKELKKTGTEDIQKEEIMDHGVTEISQTEQVQKEGEVTEEQRKPYIKKSPTSIIEDTVEKEQVQEITEKPQPFEKEKIIDLGVRKRKTQKPRSPIQTAIYDEREIGEIEESEETVARLKSPYIEADFDCVEKIHLVLPRQKFNAEVEQGIPKYINYSLKLNNEEKEIQARIFPKHEYAEAREQRIYLKERLNEFEVVFPEELYGTPYRYTHVNEAFYVFAVIGDSKGRMLYNVELLRKKMVWILLEEDYDLASEPGEVEEQWIIDEPVDWIWEKYRPILVNLRKIDILIIRNRKTGIIETKLPCEPAFHLESEQLIEDDFKNTCPLFRGGTLRITAPHENQQGWNVWIQNRTLGSSRMIAENWTGNVPLILNLAEVLPCSIGEFQIDVCQRGSGVSDDTLFFRWIPYIELSYPKELILPDPKVGHKSLLITVVLDDIEKWSIRNVDDGELKSKEDNSFELTLKPQEIRCQFSVREKDENEAAVRICVTIPRLKWKTSEQKDWQDKSSLVQRKQLVTGEPLDLLICTNDLNNKYDISAVLEENEQRRQGPERFVLKNRRYVLDFNRFYETIKHYENELTLKIEIRKARGTGPLEKIEILRIKPEPKARSFSEPKLDLNNLMNGICLKRICFLLRQIKDKYPKEKRNSKKIRNIYYRKLRKMQTKEEKYKKEFVIKSMVFMKFVMDKYGEKFRIKKQDKLKAKIDLFQKLLPKEFDDLYNTFNGEQECR